VECECSFLSKNVEVLELSLFVDRPSSFLLCPTHNTVYGTHRERIVLTCEILEGISFVFMKE
jgi:hypothetical protein